VADLARLFGGGGAKIYINKQILQFFLLLIKKCFEVAENKFDDLFYFVVHMFLFEGVKPKPNGIYYIWQKLMNVSVSERSR